MTHPTVALGEVADIVMGQSPDGSLYNTTGEGLPLVTGAGQFGQDRPEPNQFSRTGPKTSRVGDILVGIRASIGDLNWSDREYYLGRGVAAVRARPRLDARYAWRALELRKKWLESRATGSTFKQVRRADLESLVFPLPPLAEQRRIAAILDQAETVRAKRRSALEGIRELPQAMFLDRFGPPRDESTHPTAALGDVAEVVSGVAKGRKFNGEQPARVPYLRVANVQAGFLDLSEIKLIEALPGEVAELRLKRGDVVLTEGGDVDKLGRGAIWKGEVANCIHQNHVFRVRVHPAILHPQFFHEYLQTDVARAYFLHCAKRTTNLASINMTQLRGLRVPLPSLALQQIFAAQVAATEQLIAVQEVSLAKLDALFASLQHRAFRGEL